MQHLSINPSIKALFRIGSLISRSNSLYLWLKHLIKGRISQKRYIFYELFDRVFQYRKTMSLLVQFRTTGHVLNILILDSFLFLRQIFGLNHNSSSIRYDKASINYVKAVILSTFRIYTNISLLILNKLSTIALRTLLTISLHNIYRQSKRMRKR